MMRLVRQILVFLMLAVVPLGTLAQRKDNDKRPPKEPVKVIENRKDNRPPPPPQNSNRPKPDKKKKPD